MTRNEQFKFVEEAKSELLNWSASQGIDLFRIEFVVPFVETDFWLSVWLFYTRHSLVTESEKGVSEKLKQHFLEVLARLGYSQDHLSEVEFIFDSNENVEKNYESGYFYRLR